MVFHFKKFLVNHGNSSIKVGTDAVLLGAWAEIKNSKNILDIGTGSGIIALMMAQKNPEAMIKGIDIDENSIKEARQNFESSSWQNRMDAELVSLQDYSNATEIQFDHIISNPPFFSDSTPAPAKARNQARHTDTLSPDDFFRCCKKLLSDDGKISLIIPAYNSENWIEIAEQYFLFLSRITNVLSYPTKPVERILIEFSVQKQRPITNGFFIRKGKGLGYSEDYIELTKDFYL